MFHLDGQSYKRWNEIVHKMSFMGEVQTLAELVIPSCIRLVPCDDRERPYSMDSNEAQMLVLARRILAQIQYKKDRKNGERRNCKQFHFGFVERRI